MKDKTGLKAMRDAFAKDLYGVTVGNEHYFGSLLGEYATEQLAKDAGDAWVAEMVAVDDNPDEAREAYYYEIELKEVPNE